MNTCNKLPLFLHNEMNEKEIIEFNAHILTCKECAENVEIFHTISAQKQKKNLPANVIYGIFDKTTRKKPFWNFLRAVEFGFAAAACLFIGVFTYSTVNGNSLSYFDTDASYEQIASIDANLDGYEQIYLS
ncbi:zf-HC2 domain-containing protein [Endomicrobium proavitum]|uniref:Putative anti-sigma factor n=1 Tax=Endomicrobium proavitum TaxID=1408281 RepID=A0A0G3WIE4_9BACT|nr:zf-HC2 domain-containing protein [Endomicrobium proavitum]AKL97642.1 putative anti-sigma factor [Endomicrobium proavitum]